MNNTLLQRSVLSVSLMLALTLLGACGRTVFFPKSQKCVFDSDCSAGLSCVNQVCQVFVLPDAGAPRGIKRFGEPCDAGAECESTFCIGGPAGAFCSRECTGEVDAGCPSAYACKTVPLATATPALDAGLTDAGATQNFQLCAVDQPLLCQSCKANTDCGASGADKCLVSGLQKFCGRDCTVNGCPALYECQLQSDNSRQCVPLGKTCDCVPDTLGLQKSCLGSANQFGACVGNQTCQADGGFTTCIAPAALEETCNGADDDCDGAIDDVPPQTCSKTVGNVTCTAPLKCLASAGLVCTAKDPSPEVCNYSDDDCNGRTDETFIDMQGRYTTKAHCGVCGNNCDTAIANAVDTTCDISGATPTCRVQRCAAGFFPFANGTLCLQLPDTLCQPCSVDTDCVGPASRCITVDGAKVCGRDCSPTSLYPACPGGYQCSTVTGGPNQCTPSTGTCTCTSATQGSNRSCTVSTCKGFETCGPGPSGPTWSTCDVNTFNPEICDAKDNNCNGQTDEGFRNPANQRYEAAQHCGFCNNDCTRYFSPVLQHTTGVCDVTPAMPTCAMGACLTETVGPTTFEWVNVNGLPRDGCECRRVQGNLGQDLPDRAPATGTAASWVDENCDGVDGVVTDAIFVSAAANAGGNGTRTTPFKTVTEGLSAMRLQNKRYVLVAQGLYRENLRLFDGAQLFGGYSADFLIREPKSYPTTLEGVAPSGAGATLAIAPIHAEGLGTGAAETVIVGFTIHGWDVSTAAAEGADGAASIGVYLRNCGPRVIIQTNDILGGRGGNGGRGTAGTQGFGRQSSPALNGQAGQDSEFFSAGVCTPAFHRTGASAGVNTQCPGANASRGGSVVCPVYVFAGNRGNQQEYVPGGAASRNGTGGFDWSFDTLSGFNCGHVTESGFPVSIQSHDGNDGLPGPDGTSGTGGSGAPSLARFGSIVNGVWVGAATRPGGGTGGAFGLGGGGGGAGGGVARFTTGGCQGWEIGATGGGAGAGGCGGAGGLAGGAGGASFALMIAFDASTAPANGPAVTGNRLQRGAGGVGGSGGFGGAGGQAGSGGFGGIAGRWSSSVGGKGGEGGNGGPGGGGGGGAGGPSVAILGVNVNTQGLTSTNTLLTNAGTNTGGLGGSGGSSPGSTGGSGADGVRGGFADQLTLLRCNPGCAAGFTCDANSVCVPN